MSSNVPIDVVVGLDDGFNVSLNIGLGLGLGEEWDEGLIVVLFIIDYCFLNTFIVAWPSIVFNFVKTWSLCKKKLDVPFHLLCMFSTLSKYLVAYS